MTGYTWRLLLNLGLRVSGVICLVMSLVAASPERFEMQVSGLLLLIYAEVGIEKGEKS